MRAFFHEALGRGHPDPAAAARYDGDLIFQLFHSPSSFVAWGHGMGPRRGQSCASPPSTASSLEVRKQLADDARKAAEIGRANARTPGTNAHLVCRLLRA